MFVSLLSQNFLSFVWFSVPFMVFYCHKPKFALSTKGALLCSLFLGLRFFTVSYYQTTNMVKKLQYAPTGKSREYFDQQIKKVGLNPNHIILRYGYCDKSVALTSFNTVIIDQMLWKGMGGRDPMRTAAQKIVKIHVQPTLPMHSKQFHKKLKNALTRDVQKFVFKHELGHVIDRYSWKALLLTGAIGFVSAYSGIYALQLLLVGYKGVVAFGGAIGVASIVHLSLTYLSNALFKAPKEREADMFAVKHSSKREIKAAADFFEKYERYSKEYRKLIGDTYSEKAPRLLMGYYSGKERVQYLRDSIK